MLKKRGRLVLRKDVAVREKHSKGYLANTTAIMAMPATQQMLAKTTTLLDQRRSVAAKFRFLNHHGLAAMSASESRQSRFSFTGRLLRAHSGTAVSANMRNRERVRQWQNPNAYDS
jgi:hypothetical protein